MYTTIADEPLDVEKVQARMMAVHDSGVNLSYEWRRKQLKTLLQMIQENTEEIREALCQDLGREGTEAISVETKPLEQEIKFVLGNLRKWMKPEAVPSPMIILPAWSYIQRKPLNAPGVLIIGPYNYPVRMVLQPLVGALAGGNPTVIKPSDFTPNVGNVLKKLLERYFTEPGVVQVILGAVPETTALLQKPWGKVFFTGSERVGRIIQKSCAETMTPTIMELGGKCPVIVDESVSPSHIQNVADRIVFAKCLNAGQTCITCDTLIVHSKHTKALCASIKKAVKAQFGEDQKQGELARIVNKANTERIYGLIQDAELRGTQIVHGGTDLCDVENKYICPTFLLDPPAGSRVLEEEIFGPALPMVTVNSREEAIQTAQKLPGEPLHMYVFTPDTTVFEQYTNRVRCSGALRNDVLVQGSSSFLPLGGIGTSGHGNYFGRFSFEAFTHVFPVCHRPLGAVYDLFNVRCHPYAGAKSWLVEKGLLELPSVPVLHTRAVLAVVGTGSLVMAVPELRDLTKKVLISAAEKLIDVLQN